MSDHFVTSNNLLRLFTDLLSFLKDVGFLGSYSLTYSYGDHSTDGVWWYEDASRHKFITTLSQIKHVIQAWESVSSINKSVLENLGSSIPVEKTDENAVKEICESLELEARELLDEEGLSRDSDTQQPLTPFPFLEQSKDFDEQIHKHTIENKILDENIGEKDNYNKTQETVKTSELECPQCNKCFSTKAHLRRHIKSHTGERGYQCDLCERSYTAKQGLASHLLREHNLNTARAYPCNWCGKTFALKAERDKHSVVHSATKPFSCHVCERTFSQKVSRDAHLALHTGVYPFSCPQCGKSFALQAKLNAHVLTHGAPRFQCEICEKKFARHDCLRQHLKLHAGIRPYPCETCGKAFRSNYALTSHQHVHSEGSRHMCDHCGAQFRQKSSLVLHIRRHTLEGLHTCTTCGKTYVKLYDLQRHSSSHSHERAFLCDTCGKDFKSQGDLQEHRRKLHNSIQTKTTRRNNAMTKKKEIIYSCPSCPKQFKTRSRLSTHKQQHNEQPRYECTTCGKRFYRSDVLKNHMFLHTGNRPFTCEQCNKSFASQTNFKAHLIVHGSNLQFTCDICGKIYRRQSSLNVHLKKHNKKTDDENNISHYECHICKRQFDSKLSLGGHLKSHNTNDRPFACVLCNKRYKKRKHWREHVQKSHSDLTELDVTNVTNTVVFREEQDENNYNTNYNTITQQQQQQQTDQNNSVINTQYNTQTLEPFSSIQTDNLITQDLDTLHILQQLVVEVSPTNNVNIEENQQNSDAQNFLLQCVEQTILADAPSLLAEAISAAAADLSDSLATLPPDATLL